MTNPLAELEQTIGNSLGTPSEFTTAAAAGFPDDLAEIGHWATFIPFETTQVTRFDRGEKKNKSLIRLPLPGNLQTAYNISYTETQHTAVEFEMLEALRGTSEVVNAMKDKLAPSQLVTGAAIGAAIGTMFGGSMLGGALAGGAGAAAASAPGQFAAIAGSAAIQGAGELGATAVGQFGIARNPHKVVIFESVGFRQHTFSYMFTPKSYREAAMLRSVIIAFKHYAAPSEDIKVDISGIPGGSNLGTGGKIDLSAGKHFFKYPEYFEIQFNHPKFLFAIGPSFLTSVEVNYHPQGVPSYSREGIQLDPTPTQVGLSLSFKETEIITKELIARGR